VVELLAADNAAPAAEPPELPRAWRRGLDAVRNPEAEPISIGSTTSTRLPVVGAGDGKAKAEPSAGGASLWTADLPGEADLRRWLQLQAVLATVRLDDRPRRAAAVESPAASEGEAVRVPVQRLDALLALVDELRRLHPRLAHEKTGERLRAHERLRTLLDRLQQESLDLRLVPLADTFQRLHRVGRDTARQVGKEIELRADHAGVELDKNVLDRLASPLMHLVRNAIDHGLEANAAREAAGKPRSGTITIEAAQRGNRVEITVADDGAGLDAARILAKARSRGLWREGQPETPELIHPLIFLPGFSTAETVSEVSGRGVGLDVVRAVVQELDGAIRIHTERGRGSRFTVDVPMTMALQDALVVSCAGRRVVVFQNHVHETMPLREETVRSVLGAGRLLLWRDQAIPLIDLHGFLDPALPDGSAATALVISGAGQPFALGIDEVIGAQRLLVRPLGDALRDVPGLAGGCLLEDGTLALVVDPAGAMRQALRRRLLPAAAGATPAS
jgi:two-component system chemotaxis sensor kinase CheA